MSRKVGGAVERNTVKRAVREAFALEAQRLPPGADVVVIARPGARELAEREGMNGIRSALGELISKVPGAAGAEIAAVGPHGVEGVGDGVEGVGDGVEGVGDGVEGVGDGVEGVGDGVEGVGDGVEGVGDGVEGVGDGVSGEVSG